MPWGIERLEHYRILETLGEGGMGEVVLAQDETLDRRVALKAIRAERRLDPVMRERFLREARVLSALDHPGICRIHDFLRTPERDVLVLEYVEGNPLHEAIARGIDRAEQLSIAEQLADAIAAAHATGIVHRDLKPANVLLTTEGQVKVLDFGLAASSAPRLAEPPEPGTAPDRVAEPRSTDFGFRDDSSGLTVPGSVFGTLLYMAPEQARGETATTATDAFALGLVLQEVFTGLPARSPELSVSMLLSLAAEGTAAPTPGLDRELRQLLDRLLVFDPRGRATVAEARDRVRRVIDRPRRRLRQGLAAAVGLAALGGAVKYTLDLRVERDAADEARAVAEDRTREAEALALELEAQRDAAAAARAVAEDRTRQAEGLLEDAFGSLVDPLRAIDRLDVMRPFVTSAGAYFAAVAEEALTGGELNRQVELLNLAGEVALETGDRAAALASYGEARRRAEALTRENPEDPDAWQGLGDACFYVAQVHTLDREYEQALEEQQGYLDAAQRLLELRPEERFSHTNLGWAHNAVGAAWLKLGDMDRAERSTRAAEAVFQELVEEDPTDVDAMSYLADARSWLASVALGRNEVERAIEELRGELELRRRILERGGDSNHQERMLSYCESRLVSALQRARHIDEALGILGETLEGLAARVDADPGNAERRHDLAVGYYRLGTLEADAHRFEAATDALEESLALLEELNALDPTNLEWWNTQRRCALELGWTSFQLDLPEETAHWLAVSREAGERGEARADDWLRLGDQLQEAELAGLLLAREGDLDGARTLWEQALARLPTGPEPEGEGATRLMQLRDRLRRQRDNLPR